VVYAGYSPLVLVKNPNTVFNLRNYCTKPAKTLTIGTAGVNTTTGIHGELLSDTFRNCINVIPFKGNAEVLAALIGGHIDLGFVFVNDTASLIHENKLEAVAVLSTTRIKSLLDVPTIDELGIRINWFNSSMLVMANASADADLLQKIQKSLHRMLSSNTQELDKIGLTVDPGNILNAQRILNSEIKKFQQKPFSNILKPQ
jgi:tripartite-type tricarboxylate transporter receptor subunit TctC